MVLSLLSCGYPRGEGERAPPIRQSGVQFAEAGGGRERVAVFIATAAGGAIVVLESRTATAVALDRPLREDTADDRSATASSGRRGGMPLESVAARPCADRG